MIAVNHTLPDISNESHQFLNHWYCILDSSESEALKQVISLPHRLISSKDESSSEAINLCKPYANCAFIPIAISTEDPNTASGKEIVLLDEECNFRYTGNLIP